ncbi:MAG: MotA/TolQ/ExbB proton channel family protein [Bacteroidales bacterium]
MTLIIWISLFIIGAIGVVLLIFLSVISKELKFSENADEELEKIFDHNETIKYLANNYYSTLDKSINRTKDLANDYIDIDNIINKKIKIKSLSIVLQYAPKILPSLSVGLGILGTFIGFTEGIRNFDTKSADNIIRSIDQLLGGIKTAFNTSIAGMSISILFTLFYNHIIGGIKTRLEKITRHLDRKYYISDMDYLLMKLSIYDSGQPIPPASIFKTILERLSEQSQALSSFSNDIATQLGNFTSTFTQQISQEMVEKFNDEMYTLYETLITPTLQKIENLTTNLVQEKKESVGEMVQGVVRELEENLRIMIEQFKQMVSGGTKAELEELSKVIHNAGESFKLIPQLVANSVEELKFFQGEVILQMKDQTEKFHQALQTIDTIVSKESLLINTYDNLSKASGKLKEMVEPLNLGIEKLLQGIGQYEEQRKQLMDVLSQQILQLQSFATYFDSIDKNLSHVFEELSKGVQNYQSAMNEAFKTHLKEYTSSIESFSRRLSSSAESLKEAIEELSETINNSSEVA